MHSHLTQYQRIELGLLLRLGHSQRKAALELNVHPSTISRELERNSRSNGRYHARDAGVYARKRKASANATRIKLRLHPKLAQAVEAKLQLNWSPEQIAGRLRATGRTLRVCAQTVYDWLYRFRRDLLKHLHCRKGKYRRTRENTLRKAYRNRLKEERRIDRRPHHINQRKSYGHWEGDTVVGKGHSGYFVTLVERKSGYLLAAKIGASTASAFEQATTTCLKDIPERYRKTLTLDYGSEMSNYEAIEKHSNTTVYFANPYHSWERGTNENTNGLLRFYFPKKTSLASVTQEQLDSAVREINTRPRKRLDYRTPEEVFTRNW